MSEQNRRSEAEERARFGLEEAMDGELPAETADRMARHAEGCPECAEEIARLRAIKDLVRRSCASDIAPSTLRERISVEVRRVRMSHEGGSSSLEQTTVRWRG